MKKVGLQLFARFHIILLFSVVSIFLPLQVSADISSIASEEILSDYVSCTNFSNFNNVGYQYLGQGLSGTLSKVDLKVKATLPTYYGKMAGVFIYESNTFLSNPEEIINQGIVIWKEGESRNSATVVINGVDGVISFEIPSLGLEYQFNPSKHYYLVPLFHTNDGGGICQTHSIYGSADPNAYPNGEYFGDANIKDLYFVLYGLELVPVPELCCSSVIFLPGLKGSILKRGEDQVWPPTIFSNDVSQLALNDNGESIESIQVDGIVNTFYGTPIYSGFSSFMNDLSSVDPNSGTSTIHEWVPLAYDWRYPPKKIIQDGVQTASGNINIIQKIIETANNSHTGKVSIVSHSMGGIMGKAVIKELERLGKADLIESFVMVGSPQLGTPQAIGAMLHGDEEGILGGFIVNRSEIRAVARNIESSYNLLPSQKYFNSVSDPVITFDENSSFTEEWRNRWGNSIDSYSEFEEFLTGTGVSRNRPNATSLKDPEVLRSDILNSSNEFHNSYDDFVFPSNIRVVEVAGWGLPTVKSLYYKKEHGSANYKVSITREGDGTVVYPSANLLQSPENYYFDLSTFNSEETTPDYKHRDLLNSSPIQELIKNIFFNQIVDETDVLKKIKPEILNIQDQLSVSTHSPVILGAYDSSGNFTGIDLNQDLNQEILTIREEIPGSSFSYFGESQYIFLPPSGQYDFVFKGTGTGQATVEVEKLSGNDQIPINTYTDIEVTPNTWATFVIDVASPQNTVIEVDDDNDGFVNQIISPDGSETDPTLLELLNNIKEVISEINSTEKIKNRLLNQIFRLEKEIEKDKENNLKIINALEAKLGKKKVSPTSFEEIQMILELLEAQAESSSIDSELIEELKSKISSLELKDNQKQSLIKRIENLEKKTAIIKSISNLEAQILKKKENGKITESDLSNLLNLIEQISLLI